MKYAGLALLAGCVQSYERFDGDQVFRINDKTLDILKLESVLGETVDIWSHKIGAVDVRVQPAQIPKFKSWAAEQGFEPELYIKNVQSLMETETLRSKGSKKALGADHTTVEDINDFNYTSYHTYEEIVDWTHQICEQHKDICKIVEFGKSHEGRPMVGLHISAHPQGGNHHEHAFFMMAGIHAREWIAPASTIAGTNMLLTNYKNGNKQERDILHNMDWYVLPVTNVDGYAFTWEENRMWRKTRTSNDDPECVGKDPNGNWATQEWDSDVGSSSNPCSETFRGYEAMSEPCVRNVADTVRRIHEAHPIKAMFDVHSYSQMWLYPRGYSAEPTHNAGFLSKIGQFATGAIYDVAGTEFVYGSCYEVIYPATGITVDYMHDVEHVPCSVTPELRDTGRYGFLLPEDQIMPVAEEMYPGYMLMAHGVMEGYCERD